MYVYTVRTSRYMSGETSGIKIVQGTVQNGNIVLYVTRTVR